MIFPKNEGIAICPTYLCLKKSGVPYTAVEVQIFSLFDKNYRKFRKFSTYRKLSRAGGKAFIFASYAFLLAKTRVLHNTPTHIVSMAIFDQNLLWTRGSPTLTTLYSW